MSFIVFDCILHANRHLHLRLSRRNVTLLLSPSDASSFSASAIARHKNGREMAFVIMFVDSCHSFQLHNREKFCFRLSLPLAAALRVDSGYRVFSHGKQWDVIWQFRCWNFNVCVSLFLKHHHLTVTNLPPKRPLPPKQAQQHQQSFLLQSTPLAYLSRTSENQFTRQQWTLQFSQITAKWISHDKDENLPFVFHLQLYQDLDFTYNLYCKSMVVTLLNYNLFFN